MAQVGANLVGDSIWFPPVLGTIEKKTAKLPMLAGIKKVMRHQ